MILPLRYMGEGEFRMYHKTKTANERSVTAKIERTRKKHLGITSPKRPFGNTMYRKKVSGEVVER